MYLFYFALTECFVQVVERVHMEPMQPLWARTGLLLLSGQAESILMPTKCSSNLLSKLHLLHKRGCDGNLDPTQMLHERTGQATWVL